MMVTRYTRLIIALAFVIVAIVYLVQIATPSGSSTTELTICYKLVPP